jgi:hypothetical protein
MPCGDLLSLMPSFKESYESTGHKSIIYQRVNVPYDGFGAFVGARYSIKDDADVPVTMNMAVFDAVKPLLLSQVYIEDFIVWDGHEIDHNLDMLRQHDTPMPFGDINRYLPFIIPQTACDLSKPWLNIPYFINQQVIGKILINRTERYNNMYITYNFLKKYGDNVLFVGLPHEHELFCKQNNLSVQRLEAKDYFEIATALYNCKLYIGGQSSVWQIAEGLKIPRILEVCKAIPNVIGSGTGLYAFLKQEALQYYTEKLFNQ